MSKPIIGGERGSFLYKVFPGAIAQDIPDIVPFFHIVTGADRTSSFTSIGKSTFWKIWAIFRDIDKAFCLFQSTCQHYSKMEIISYSLSASSSSFYTIREVKWISQKKPGELYLYSRIENILLTKMFFKIIFKEIFCSVICGKLPSMQFSTF